MESGEGDKMELRGKGGLRKRSRELGQRGGDGE